MFKKDVLVGLGCSHTQGCAFVKNITNSENGQYELASPQLKQKYGREYVDQEFLTNVSWLGQLNKQLGFNQVLNFAGGGFGPEQNIESIKSYIIDKDNLNNHLFIWQVPSFDRITLLHKSDEVYTLETFGNLIDPDSDFKNYECLELLFDEIYSKIKLFEDVYFTQKLIQSMGGIAYFIFKPLGSYNFVTNENVDYYNNFFKVFDKVRVYKKYHTKISILDYIDKLNILRAPGFTSVNHSGIGPSSWTLKGEGLLEGDAHYSEHGNYLLAQSLYNELIQRDERLS